MTEKQKLLKDLSDEVEKNEKWLVELFHLSLHNVPDAEILNGLEQVSKSLGDIKTTIDHHLKAAKHHK